MALLVAGKENPEEIPCSTLFRGTYTLGVLCLATDLPAEALVLETDAPDIPPQWLYRTAQQRAQGQTSRNEPAELPRIARTLAALRRWADEDTARITRANACRVLPRLAALTIGATS